MCELFCASEERRRSRSESRSSEKRRFFFGSEKKTLPRVSLSQDKRYPCTVLSLRHAIRESQRVRRRDHSARTFPSTNDIGRAWRPFQLPSGRVLNRLSSCAPRHQTKRKRGHIAVCCVLPTGGGQETGRAVTRTGEDNTIGVIVDLSARSVESDSGFEFRRLFT